MNCRDCPSRFEEDECASGWPFADTDEEDTAKHTGTFESILEEKGFL